MDDGKECTMMDTESDLYQYGQLRYYDLCPAYADYKLSLEKSDAVDASIHDLYLNSYILPRYQSYLNESQLYQAYLKFSTNETYEQYAQSTIWKTITKLYSLCQIEVCHCLLLWVLSPPVIKFMTISVPIFISLFLVSSLFILSLLRSPCSPSWIIMRIWSNTTRKDQPILQPIRWVVSFWIILLNIVYCIYYNIWNSSRLLKVSIMITRLIWISLVFLLLLFLIRPNSTSLMQKHSLVSIHWWYSSFPLFSI